MNVLTTGQQSRIRSLALCLLLICANLTACGQIGPLYLPGERNDDKTPAATTTGESDPEERDNDDKPDGL